MSAVLTLREGLRSHARTEAIANILYPLVAHVHSSRSGERGLAQALADVFREERDDIVVEATATTAGLPSGRASAARRVGSGT